jgi:ribosome-associated translation inhibitor RaiA/cold shock CspA family protein
MQITPTVTFRGIAVSEALEADIRARIAKLERYYPSTTSCRVLVELAQRHHEAGNRFHVRIDLTVPGEDIVVTHDADLHAAVRDIGAAKLTKEAELEPERKHAHVAVRKAFEIARRRLQDYARRQRGFVKATAGQPVGSVLGNRFDRLHVGSRVSFVEERGNKGPQASTVKLLHPRRARSAA